MLASSVVDSKFAPWSRPAKDNKIGICCFSIKHAASSSLGRDRSNVSTSGLLFHYKNPSKHVKVMLYMTKWST